MGWGRVGGAATLGALVGVDIRLGKLVRLRTWLGGPLVTVFCPALGCLFGGALVRGGKVGAPLTIGAGGPLGSWSGRDGLGTGGPLDGPLVAGPPTPGGLLIGGPRGGLTTPGGPIISPGPAGLI